MSKFLSEEKQLLLVAAHAATRDKVIADRLKVVLWYNEGWTHQQIADALFININTSVKHLADYQKRNKLDKNSGGSSPKLNLKQSEELIALLNSTIFTKVGQIINLVKEKFNIIYSKTGMIDWLNRNNFTYKKPVKFLPKIDVEAQIKFIEHYDELKQKVILSKGKEVILHVDSSHPTMQAKPAFGWIHKSNCTKIMANNCSTRVNISGALELATMSLVANHYETIDSSYIIEFLQGLNAVYEGKTIHIILDNGRYHKTETVKNYCENNNIKLHFLPPYSPNLNPIERVWKVMNEYVRNNKTFEKPKEFRDKLDEFFTTTWQKISNEIRSQVNDNFHILTN